MGKNVAQINAAIARKREEAERTVAEANARRAMVKAEEARAKAEEQRAKAEAKAAEAAEAAAAEEAEAEEVTIAALTALADPDVFDKLRPTEDAGSKHVRASLVARTLDMARTAGATYRDSAIVCDTLSIGSGGQIFAGCLIAARTYPPGFGDMADLKGSTVWVLPPAPADNADAPADVVDMEHAVRWAPPGWEYKRDADGIIVGGLQRPKTGTAGPLSALRRSRAV